MAAQDEGWGWLIGLCVVGAGIWWWNSREPESPGPAPLVTRTTLGPIRPTEPVEITTTKTGTVWFLDPASVKGPRDKRQGWVTANHAEDKTEVARVSKTLYLVNCDTSGVKELTYVPYDKDDQVMTDRAFSRDDPETSYYPPGTIGASVPDEVCKPIYD